MCKRLCFFAGTLSVLLFSCIVSIAQSPALKRITSANRVICYQQSEPRPFHIAPPESFRAWRQNASSRSKISNFEVEYINFPTEARNAFQFAVDIWETQISSSIPIRIRAQWGPLASGVLGQASWSTAIANFNGAQHLNVYYPVALAEKISGAEQNASNESDIDATFNSNGNWYFGTDGAVPAGKMDFVMVVLHEICHGLGFIDTYATEASQGSVGLDNIPFVYDLYVVNSSKQSIFSAVPSPSTTMKGQLTSNNLFYNSKLATIAGVLPKLYAPATFDGGSSIAHLDESTYSTPGDANNLMTPQIALQESIHQPGAITLGILNDMGWVSTRIDHSALKDSERKDGSGYPVKATVISDNGFKPATLTLNYRSASSSSYTAVQMTPTGVTNEFQAMLPGTLVNTQYAYFISVEDNLSRIFTNPGKVYAQNQAVEQGFNVITIAPDTQGPQIQHTPIDFIYNTDAQMLIEAQVTDNLGVASVNLEYQINNAPTQNVVMTKSSATDLYATAIALPGSLAVGDKIKYKIVARDLSASANQSVSPAADFYNVYVTGDMPARSFYVNDFNNESFDFIGNSFAIRTPLSFSNGAIHSEHPYQDGSGTNNESNYIFQLQVPITVSASNHFIKFDEIVLVEPGESGSNFGDGNFFDYVIVEGSKNNGVTWVPLGEGYDSRQNSDWLARYNASIIGDNSTSSGTPALFRERLIDILTSSAFKAGDEIKIRFRLFADQAAHGWGWAIDNLSIQGPVTSLELQAQALFQLFPNPAKDHLFVNLQKNNCNLALIDAQGRKIFTAYVEGTSVDVDLRSLVPGLYFLRVVGADTVATQKFVKE